MNDNAKYCENCGSSREGHDQQTGIGRGEIVRSTRIFTSQQVLIISILLIGGGIMSLFMSSTIPDDPFFDDMRWMPVLAGLIMIGMGGAIYFFGNSRPGPDR